MKKTVLSVLLTLCTALLALAFSVQADTAPTLSAANGGDYPTVEAALAAAEQMASKGELDEKGVKIVLTGEHTATVKDGVLFGQKTIFLPNGRKLPVTLTGGTLRLPAGNVACTNDYTFTGIKIPFDDEKTSLFAGSGNVRLEQITTDLNGTLEYKSAFYGDSFTAKVFEGWTEKSLDLYREKGLFVSSVTLGDGFVYENTSGYLYGAVGASTDFSASVGSVTLSAKDTCPKLVVDGAVLSNTMARIGSNPVGNSVLHVKKGSVNHLYAAGHGLQSEHTGDITLLAEGGTFRHFVRAVSGLTLNGNLTVSLKNVDLSANANVTDGKMIQTFFGTCTVFGDVLVSMENVKADRYYGSFGDGTLTGDVSVTAKDCEFSAFYYGGMGKSEVYGNVENRLENVTLGNFRGGDECPLLGDQEKYSGKRETVGDVVNDLKNVTFTRPSAQASVYFGCQDVTRSGTVRNTLNQVTVPADLVVYCGNRSGNVDGVVNLISDSVFSDTFCGGGAGGTVGNVLNEFSDTTFNEYLYLAGGSITVTGQVDNRLTDCVSTKYYTFGGVNGGKILNSHLEYGVRNRIEGGSYRGFWGGSGSSNATHKGNIYTEILSGDFYGYDATKNNSVSGGCRNTRHQGNAVTLIRGGTFHGLVAGGSIPNSETYAKEHTGKATLTLAGGTFRDGVISNCLWGSYPEAVTDLDTKYALEPFSFERKVVCRNFIAGSDHPTVLSFPLRCENLIALGKGALQICSEAVCDQFIREESAPAPEVYATVRCGELDVGSEELILGAKAKILADSVRGSIRLHQTEFWLKGTYFTSPETTVITLSQAEGVMGEAEVKAGTVTGKTGAFAGVGIRFSDKVSLRFAFDKEWVEALKDSFTFTASCGDRVIVNETDAENLIFKDGCYTLLSAPLSAAELGETVSYSGTLAPAHSFTLSELAANGVAIYGKEGRYEALGELLKAFANFTVAADNYKNGRSNPMPYECKAVETGFTSGDGFAPMIGTPLVTLTGRQLVLDDGMRIRYHLRSDEMKSSMRASSPVRDLYYFYNCTDVTDHAEITWVPTSTTKGYLGITVDLPVSPTQSREDIRFMVSDKENLHLALPVDSTEPYTSYIHEDYVDRLDKMAEDLAGVEGSEELGSALLYYLQAGADYYLTQPDLSAFTYPEAFSAGYAREDVSPHGFIVDLSGSKVSTAVLDPLYVTCLALWDGEDLALFFSVDVRQCPEYLTDHAKELLAEEFDIDPDMIFFNATHNHSSPNTTSQSRTDMKKWYGEIFFPKMLLSARKAVLDLAPSTLYTGTANSDPGTNYVRRYVNADGSFTGIHNIVPATNVVAYETEADKELRALRFDRGEKKDILFVNWQGHAAHGAAYRHAATADFVGFLRDGVEKDLDVHFIYCNGASGNLNFTPKVASDVNAKYFTNPYFQGIGKSLVGTVKKAVEGEKSIRTGEIQVTYIPFVGVIRHDDEATVDKANACYTDWQAYKKEKGSDPSAGWFQTNYGFQSRYEVSAIRTRAGLGETETLPVWAFSFGDVGMAFAPYEMFDTNGQQIRDASPFAVTVIGGYTNGTRSYVPSGYAAPHNGYEVYTCRYVFTTGDDVATELGNALKKMYD